MKKWIYIAIFITCGQKLASQNNCDNLIEEATDLYNLGNYDECINVLENGLNTCALSKSKKESAYILLINSNIEKDSLQGIDKNFRLLLTTNPTFKIKDYNGLDDFKKYYKNYYAFPRLAFGMRPHYSTRSLDAFQVYQVMPNIKNESMYNTSNFFNNNVIFDFRITEKIALFADGGYFNLEYNRELKNDYWTLRSAEKITYFQLDLGVKRFYRTQKKLNPYWMAGLSNQYLMGSKLTLNQTKTVVNSLYGGTDIPEYKFLTDYNSEAIRNHYVYSLLLGGGIIYKIGYLGIGIDFRLYYSLNTVNNPTARARSAEPDLIKDFGYIDNDFRMFKTDKSLIITYLLYKVKRKKIITN